MEDNKSIFKVIAIIALLLAVVSLIWVYRVSKNSGNKTGQDTSKFSQCLDSDKYAQEVKKDVTDGTNYSVTGTPTFFIAKGDIIIDPDYVKSQALANILIFKSGTANVLIGAQPFFEFEKIIEEELKKQGQENGGGSKLVAVSVDDDPAEGDPNAPVTIVEFSDFQCPFCARFVSETMPQIVQNYVKTGKVKFVFRDFPLSNHQFAQKSAEATQCAADQNKFWEMHDKIFANQTALSENNLKKYAKDLGLE